MKDKTEKKRREYYVMMYAVTLLWKEILKYEMYQ